MNTSNSGISQRNETAHPSFLSSATSSHPDLLAGAVLSSLTRPIYFPLSWGLLSSFLVTALSLGFAPILLIPYWLKGVIAQHQQQLWHLAEWLRLQTGSEKAIALQEASTRIRFNSSFVWLARFCALVAAVFLVHQFNSIPLKLRSIYAFGFGYFATTQIAVFMAAMFTAAVFTALLVILHVRNVERYVRLFNQLADEQQWPRLQPPHRQGFGLLWMAAGVSLFIIGGFWGLPAMLAMGLHRRYTMGASVEIRAQLAERMRGILKSRQPVLKVPEKPMTVLRLCLRPNCRAPLTFEAVFCPRCGTRVAKTIDVVA